MYVGQICLCENVYCYIYTWLVIFSQILCWDLTENFDHTKVDVPYYTEYFQNNAFESSAMVYNEPTAHKMSKHINSELRIQKFVSIVEY